MPVAFGSAGFAGFVKAWPMSISSAHFLIFLPLCVGGYFALPQKARRPWLLLCSYWFYFFAAPKYLPVLLFGTLVSFLLGLWVGAGKQQKSRSRRMAVGVVLLVLGLCFFKYNAFFAKFLSPLFSAMGVNYSGGYFITAAALGISFYTFTAIGYLIDVSAGTAPAEKNFLNYALFLGFFPSVSMGPISRAGDLMPQLKDDARRFSPQGAADGLRQMAWGFFQKMAVADGVAVFVGYVYGQNLGQYSGLTIIFANIGFMLQLYFDFAGYTNIALGAAKMLGIALPRNFNTPFYATNFSGFWARWHMSLSSWLQDYIFTPLVWSRWPEKLPFIGKRVAKPPVLSSIIIVFMVSGIWHGDTMCFLVWGALQAAFRVGEELLHRGLGKPKKRPPRPVRFGKTLVVRILWMESLVFFRVGLIPNSSVADAFGALARQFTGYTAETAFSVLPLRDAVYDSVFYGVYNNGIIVAAFLLFTTVCLAAALMADRWQFNTLKGREVSEGIAALPKGRRWVCYYLIVLCCFAAFLVQGGGFGGSNFIYGGF